MEPSETAYSGKFIRRRWSNPRGQVIGYPEIGCSALQCSALREELIG